MLIHGAGGGVGTFAVQLAHAAGAHVVATGRAWARPLVTELGADEFIDLERESFEDVVSAVDLVLDLMGGDILRRSWAVVKPDSALVSAVQDPAAAIATTTGTAAAAPRARSVFFVVMSDRAELVALGRRIEAGALRPIIGGVVPLAEGRSAFETKHRGGVPGKLVFAVAD